MDYRDKLKKDPQVVERFITIGKAFENINERTNHVIILPPNYGDQDIVTDEEDEPQENMLSEQDGEIVLIHSENKDEEEVSRMVGLEDITHATVMEDEYPLLVEMSHFYNGNNFLTKIS